MKSTKEEKQLGSRKKDLEPSCFAILKDLRMRLCDYSDAIMIE